MNLPPPGLRERRKQETAAQITRAAFLLAREHGVEAVTVEMICAAAGVSQRTFFNYFPYREAVFAPPPPPLPEDAVASFLAGDGPLLEALIALLVAQVTAAARDKWMGELLQQIRRADPKIEVLMRQQLHIFDGELALLIARRRGFAAADQGSRVVAAAVLSAMRVVLDDMLAHPGLDPDAAVRAGLGQLRLLVEPSIH